MFENMSFTRLFGHFHSVSANFWINLLFPAILVTFTRHVTSRGSHDVIIGSLITLRLLLCSFYRRNIKREFQRHPDDVILRPPVNSDLWPPWLVRNWTWKFIFMNGQSRIRLSSTDDLLSIVTAAEILIRWHVTWHIQPRHVTIYHRQNATEIDIRKTYQKCTSNLS